MFYLVLYSNHKVKPIDPKVRSLADGDKYYLYQNNFK